VVGGLRDNIEERKPEPPEAATEDAQRRRFCEYPA